MNGTEPARTPALGLVAFDEASRHRSRPVRTRPTIDDYGLVRALQVSLDPGTLLGIFSDILRYALPHEGLSFVHPEFAAHVGDGGFFTCDWPLQADGHAVGQLRVHSCEAPDAQGIGLLTRITPLLAQPMNNALTCERLRRHAREDALTGLLNRAALERILPREISLAHRESKLLSVLMIDIDHFKQVNDCWGHALGDRALALTAEVLRECLRQSDLAFRYGGEEFVAALPDTGLSGACQAAERILESLRTHSRQRLPQLITASIGVATIEAGGANDSAGLLQRADRGLYLAKAQGRDCVVSA